MTDAEVTTMVRDLSDRLLAAGEAHGLKARRLAAHIPHVLIFTQPLTGDCDCPATEAQARAMFTGLSQTVALLPDDTQTPDVEEPLRFAWYWWWKGDRGVKPSVPIQPGAPGRGDEKERLADAEEIDYAILRIRQVIRLVDSSV